MRTLKTVATWLYLIVYIALAWLVAAGLFLLMGGANNW